MRTKTPLLAERMLDAAGRLFAERHFHAVRMEDVAGEAGVAKGTLYSYFRDKEALYLALLERASGQFVARLEEAVAEGEGPRRKLEAVVAAILEYLDAQPHLLALIQRAELSRDSGAIFKWQPAREAAIRLLLGLFREAKGCGEFAIRDPDLAVLMLLGGLRSVFRLGKRPRPPDLARQIVRDFLEGHCLRERTARPRLKPCGDKPEH